MDRRGSTVIIVLLILAAVLIVGGIWYHFSRPRGIVAFGTPFTLAIGQTAYVGESAATNMDVTLDSIEIPQNTADITISYCPLAGCLATPGDSLVALVLNHPQTLFNDTYDLTTLTSMTATMVINQSSTSSTTSSTATSESSVATPNSSSTARAVTTSMGSSLNGQTQTLGTANPTLQPQIGESLFYISSDTLYRFDTETLATSSVSLPGPVDVGGDLLVSSKYLFVSYDTSIESEEIYAYDFSKNATVTLPQPHEYNWIESLSPDNQYADLDGNDANLGTSQNVVNLQTEQTLFDVSTARIAGSPLIWSPDGSKFVQPWGEGKPLYVGESGYTFQNYSLVLYSISNNATSAPTIFPATADVSFTPLRWMDDNHLLYEEDTFQPTPPEPVPDGYATSAESYWDTYWNDPIATTTRNYFIVDINTVATTSAQPLSPTTQTNVFPSPSGQWKVVLDCPNQGPCNGSLEKSDGSQIIPLGAIWNARDIAWQITSTTQGL